VLRIVKARFEVDIEEGKPRDDGKLFPPKNIIKDYIVPMIPENLTKEQELTLKENYSNELNDDIPF